LEYAKDEVFTVGSREIVTPRANRVILATRPKEAIMGFQEDMVPHLESLGREADLAFMAGYHYTEEVQADGRTWEEYLADTQRDLAALRSQNPNLRIHYEYVPMKVEELEPQVLTSICGQVQSFGVNENEIKRVLKNYGFTEEYEAIQADERAYTLYKGAVRLFRHWGLERLHVHNLGYYVVVLAKPYPVSVEKVRQACLYASAVNALKAKYGGYAQPEKLGETIDWPLSDIGFAQLRSAYTDLREEIPGLTEEFLATGILEQDDHYLLVVPSHVIPNPVSTVGMGDTISSSSYLAELDG
ncbi:MAG: ADP-dependent glucokinase/phosphofructokinase, partial [Limnochordia bacterium]